MNMTHQFPFLTSFLSSGSKELSETEKISLRPVKGESDSELTGDEVEEGQTVEQEGESSEEDVSPLEEPNHRQSDSIHQEETFRVRAITGNLSQYLNYPRKC